MYREMDTCKSAERVLKGSLADGKDNICLGWTVLTHPGIHRNPETAVAGEQANQGPRYKHGKPIYGLGL